MITNIHEIHTEGNKTLFAGIVETGEYEENSETVSKKALFEYIDYLNEQLKLAAETLGEISTGARSIL